MEKKLVLIYSGLILYLFNFWKVQGACDFPSDVIGGTWRSTRWDDIDFTTTEMTIPDFDGSPLTFECDTKSGTKYLIRSTVTKLILTNTVDVAACLDFASGTSGVKYIYYHATVERSLPGGIYHPVRLISPPGRAMTISEVCTVTSYDTGSNDVLINVDAISDAVVTCPNNLLADFNNYNVTDFSGTTYCDGTGYIHTCDDSRTVIVEYGVCSEQIFYSAGGNLSCVYSSSSGGVTYANLLNNDNTVDNSNTYYYVCVQVYKSGGVWFASQWPRKCSSDQTPISVPSAPGYVFQLHANLTCVPSSGGAAFSIIPIIAAVVGVLLISVLVYYFCIKKKKYKKMPCYDKGDKKKKKKKKSQVDPTSADVSMSAAPMDGHRTGLQATAIFGYPDRSSAITPFERRNLETAQSTRSAVTVSHMDAELLEDQPPRRLPPLMPQPPNQMESDTSDTPSIPPPAVHNVATE